MLVSPGRGPAEQPDHPEQDNPGGDEGEEKDGEQAGHPGALVPGPTRHKLARRKYLSYDTYDRIPYIPRLASM